MFNKLIKLKKLILKESFKEKFCKWEFVWIHRVWSSKVPSISKFFLFCFKPQTLHLGAKVLNIHTSYLVLGHFKFNFNCLSHRLETGVKLYNKLLCISTSESMLEHAFAWSKTIKIIVKWVKQYFFHHAYERLTRGLRTKT